MFNSFLRHCLLIQLHKPKFLLNILKFSQHVKKITGALEVLNLLSFSYQRPVDHYHPHTHLVNIQLQDPF